MVEIKNIYGDVIYTAKDATTVKQAVALRMKLPKGEAKQ
jgi:hypothetical protein